MKHAIPLGLIIFAGCSGAPLAEWSGGFDPIPVAGQIIRSNNWSQSDPASGKVISETEAYWDLAFPIPDAIQGGEKPDHRIIRVFKKTQKAKELGVD